MVLFAVDFVLVIIVFKFDIKVAVDFSVLVTELIGVILEYDVKTVVVVFVEVVEVLGVVSDV